MPQLPQTEYALLILTVAFVVIGCGQQEPGVIQEPDVIPATETPGTQSLESQDEAPAVKPTEIIITTEATSTTVAIPDSGWQVLRPGLERRLVTVHRDGAAVPEKFYMLRFDNDYFRFGVGYDPDQPQRLIDWMNETGALMVVNGGYFTDIGEATGALVVNGQHHGTSYQGFGGMLTVTATDTELRWLPQQPYSVQEPIIFGLQSFPMLVTPGNQIGYPEEDGASARRTVIAQDRQGRILFVLASSGTYTLHQLSQFLVASDLDLEMALNLDGGSSTGLILADPVEGVPPFTLLPIVITVHPK